MGFIFWGVLLLFLHQIYMLASANFICINDLVMSADVEVMVFLPLIFSLKINQKIDSVNC